LIKRLKSLSKNNQKANANYYIKQFESAESLWLESAKDMNIEIPEPSFSVTQV